MAINNMKVVTEDGFRKMNGEEILYALIEKMNNMDLVVLGKQINAVCGTQSVNRKDGRRMLVHGILDAYRFIKGEDVKMHLKKYQKKYMAGSSPMPSEEMLCVTLANKALDAFGKSFSL